MHVISAAPIRVAAAEGAIPTFFLHDYILYFLLTGATAARYY